MTVSDGAIVRLSFLLYAPHMGFSSLSEALRREVLRRIDTGDLTGTELARRVGFTQAHVSNFLNRKRGLKLSALDRALRALDLTIYDLLDPAEVGRYAAVPESQAGDWVDVPLVAMDVAAAAPIITEGHVRERAKYRRATLERIHADAPATRKSWTRFVVVQAAAGDADAMWPRITPGAQLLVDRHWIALRPYSRERRNIYLVHRKDANVVRYVEAVDERLILRPHSADAHAEIVDVAEADSRSGIVGRVAGISVEL